MCTPHLWGPTGADTAGAGAAHARPAEITLDERTGSYKPLFYRNEFWLMREDYMLINSTVKCVSRRHGAASAAEGTQPPWDGMGVDTRNRSVDLHLEFTPISLTRWQIYSQLEKSLAMQEQYGLSDGQSDEFRVRPCPPLSVSVAAMDGLANTRLSAPLAV